MENILVITEAADHVSAAFCSPRMHLGLDMFYEINSAIDL